MVYIFWGAGLLGKLMAKSWHGYGCESMYFVDSDSRLWGSMCEGLPVCSPEKIMDEKRRYQIIVTCKKDEGIYQKLAEYGVLKADVIKMGELWRILPDIWDGIKEYDIPNNPNGAQNRFGKVLFDLQRGLILGGVEAWTFQTAELLRRNDIESGYLVLDRNGETMPTEARYLIRLGYPGHDEIKRKIEAVAEAVWQNGPCNAIAAFTGIVFWGICYAKHMRPNELQVIAVVHNDEAGYYDAYMGMERYIDKCIIISTKMKDRLLERGFPEEKICFLPWKIACGSELKRGYSLKRLSLSLGYAGRVTVRQKRMDLLWKMVQRLEEKDMDFVLEIAGDGDYMEEFLSLVKRKKLQEKVRFLGFIPREEIPSFWQRQDIMVSCSDWEGHSISQAEAMAAGAVPIITDVSGARDDVDDGENGFVVEVGDVDGIVEKICFLYEHRELLPIMGRKAYESIKAKSEAMNLEEFWKSILI